MGLGRGNEGKRLPTKLILLGIGRKRLTHIVVGSLKKKTRKARETIGGNMKKKIAKRLSMWRVQRHLLL